MAKKFHPITFFDAAARKDPSYRLLPARFIALDDHRYLLTNDVGEFLVTTRASLDALVQHRLVSDDPFYHDLKAKHFLLDGDSTIALDLLALKYRTRAQRVAEFTGLHLFVVTLRCDYSCTYCQVSRQTEDAAAFDMTVETADRALDLVFRSPSPHLKIEFQGGEPLLNRPLIAYIVQRAKLLNAKHQRALQFVVTTNLSALDDAFLEFCREHDLYLSTSLDGPEDLHNRNRPRPGRDGFQKTVEGILRARAVLGKDHVGALMTTTEASLARVSDIVDTYVGLGFEGMFLRPLSPYGFAVRTRQAFAYDAERWLEFYRQGLDYILALNRAGYRFVEYYTALLLSKLFSPFGTGYVDLRSPAGVAISAVVYNYDGEVYASDESRMLAEMGDKTFRLGNVHTDSYESMLLSDTLLEALDLSLAESVPHCSDCGFLPYCGADPVYHHATQGDVIGHKALSGFCIRHMGMLRHLFLRLEDHPEDRALLLNWIRP